MNYTNKLSALVDRFYDIYDDPKRFERLVCRTTAVFCHILSVLTAAGILLGYLITGDLAWWHFITAGFFWIIGRAALSGVPKRYTAPTVEVRSVETSAPSVTFAPSVQQITA